MPVLLNKTHSKKTVNDLTVGQVGYTVYWALATNKKGELFIKKDYTVSSKSGGTVHVKVGRTLYGLFVDVSTLKEDDDIKTDIGWGEYAPIDFDHEPDVWELAKIALEKRDYAAMKSLFK